MASGHYYATYNPNNQGKTEVRHTDGLWPTHTGWCASLPQAEAELRTNGWTPTGEWEEDRDGRCTITVVEAR
jgi:hypothetical protein